MSCPLPPEILDLIVDHLHNEPSVLRTCCIVSKSWVPRTRRHLFACVEFRPGRFSIESWIKAFPDPSNSPAHFTRALTIIKIQTTTAVGVDVGRWIRAFRSVVDLYVDILSWGDQVSLVPFYGLSPFVKSLRLYSATGPPSEVFGFVCSFPLLEDLALSTLGDEDVADGRTVPSTSPRFTGSLELGGMFEGIGPAVRRLLDLPNGPRFKKIVLGCIDETDFKSTTDLASGCSGTLEHFDVIDCLPGAASSIPLHDLYLIDTLRLVHDDFV